MTRRLQESYKKPTTLQKNKKRFFNGTPAPRFASLLPPPLTPTTQLIINTSNQCRAEEEAKSQLEIIKMLMTEKETVEKSRWVYP